MMKLTKCSEGAGCSWCKDETKGKATWFYNYLIKKKGTSYYDTKEIYEQDVKCIHTVFSSPSPSIVLKKRDAAAAWRLYKSRNKNTSKKQANYMLSKKTIIALRLSAEKNERPLNLELEIIINTYLEMKNRNLINFEMLKEIEDKLK